MWMIFSSFINSANTLIRFSPSLMFLLCLCHPRDNYPSRRHSQPQVSIIYKASAHKPGPTLMLTDLLHDRPLNLDDTIRLLLLHRSPTH